MGLNYTNLKLGGTTVQDDQKVAKYSLFANRYLSFSMNEPPSQSSQRGKAQNWGMNGSQKIGHGW